MVSSAKRILSGQELKCRPPSSLPMSRCARAATAGSRFTLLNSSSGNELHVQARERSHRASLLQRSIRARGSPSRCEKTCTEARTRTNYTPPGILIPPSCKVSLVARRSMSKGQQAMAYAKIYPEGKRGAKRSSVSEGLSYTRVSVARTVLRLAEKYDARNATLRVAGECYQVGRESPYKELSLSPCNRTAIGLSVFSSS